VRGGDRCAGRFIRANLNAASARCFARQQSAQAGAGHSEFRHRPSTGWKPSSSRHESEDVHGEEPVCALDRSPDWAFLQRHFDQYEKNAGSLGRYRALLATLNKQSPITTDPAVWGWLNAALETLSSAL
jgi:hypothetical protein